MLDALVKDLYTLRTIAVFVFLRFSQFNTILVTYWFVKCVKYFSFFWICLSSYLPNTTVNSQDY